MLWKKLLTAITGLLIRDSYSLGNLLQSYLEWTVKLPTAYNDKAGGEDTALFRKMYGSYSSSTGS